MSTIRLEDYGRILLSAAESALLKASGRIPSASEEFLTLHREAIERGFRSFRAHLPSTEVIESIIADRLQAPPAEPHREQGEWDDANRLASLIYAVVDREISSGTSPVEILVGLSMGLMGFMDSAPEYKPGEFSAARAALKAMLDVLGVNPVEVVKAGETIQ